MQGMKRVKVNDRPDLGFGEVLRIQESAGQYMADVAFEVGNLRILETYPSTALEAVPTIFERYLQGESDAVTDFCLKQLAFQIPVENAGGELSNSRTDLLPHQILLTHQIVNAQRRRFLIADEVGLGKTIEAGMILRELQTRGEARRILIICPAGLTVNWQRELRDCFRMDLDIFGKDFTDRGFHPWEKHHQVIISIDTIKKPNRLEKLLAGPDWQIIVFDEAHHLSRKRYGNKIQTTQNYRLAEKVKGKTRDLLFLTATPHQGEPYQFWSLIQLLDDQLFAGPEAMKDHRGLLGRVMFRRIKREVTDPEGNPIFMRRQVHSQRFQLSFREQRFYEQLTEYLREGYNAAGAGQEKTTKNQRAVGFVMATFQKIMSSSPRAIKQALRRRLLAIYARKQMALESGELGSPTRRDISSRIIRYQENMRAVVGDLMSYRKGSFDYTDADAYIVNLKQRLRKRPRFHEELTHWALDMSETDDRVIEAETGIPNEEEKVRDLIDLLGDGPDRKFDTLIRAIEQIRRENPHEKMIIFTQYLETLYFLQEELSAYYPQEKIVTVKGGPLDDKIASCEAFWDSEGAQFLLSTSAGGEGINLQVCRILFNYDLPWNPMAVEQRIGRIHRYGQTDTVQVYNLVAEDTIEEKVYAILEEKLREIARVIGKVDSLSGEVSEDFRSEILGFLGSSTNYNELYREALLHRDYARTAGEIEAAIKQARQASEALRELTQNLNTFNLEHYRKLKGKFGLKDLKDFVASATIHLGGSFIPSDDLVSLHIPPVLKSFPEVASNYENITFSREAATRKRGVELLGLGHPVIDALIAYCRSDVLVGEVLNIDMEGAPSSLNVRYLFIVEFEDGSKKEVYRNLLVEGAPCPEDLELLRQNTRIKPGHAASPQDIETRVKALVQNEEAQLRASYNGIRLIRSTCVGIQRIN